MARWWVPLALVLVIAFFLISSGPQPDAPPSQRGASAARTAEDPAPYPAAAAITAPRPATAAPEAPCAATAACPTAPTCPRSPAAALFSTAAAALPAGTVPLGRPGDSGVPAAGGAGLPFPTCAPPMHRAAALAALPPPTAAGIDACDMSEGYAERLPAAWLASAPRAYNSLDDAFVPQHPVMSALLRATGGAALATQPEYVREETGLCVPYGYDCALWGSLHPYHIAMPSRWTRCASHRARTHAALRSFAPELPYIDEEYMELVAVYTAVLAAPAGALFRVAELGARWGTWGARAAAFARAARPDLDVRLLFYEPDELFADGLVATMALNGITAYELVRGFADAEKLAAWLAGVERLDVLDLDIQGAEAAVLPPLMAALASKAVRVIVGTHSAAVHAQMLGLFATPAWTPLRSMPYTSSEVCMGALHSTVGTFPGGWEALHAGGCVHAVTDVGRVSQWDGELIFDNAVLATGPARSQAACML